MLEFQTILILCATLGIVITYAAIRVTGRRNEKADLLSEICEEREALRRMMAALPEQLELAKRSKIAAADIIGRATSDETGLWLSELEADLAHAKALESQLPPAEVEHAGRTGMELDLRLVEILALSIRATRLAEKYSHSGRGHGEVEQSGLLAEPRSFQPSLSTMSP